MTDRKVRYTASGATTTELDFVLYPDPGYRVIPRPAYYRPAKWLVSWVMDRLSTHPLARWDWSGRAYQWVGAHVMWHVADRVEGTNG